MGKTRVEPLPYPQSHDLLKGKTVLVTAAAGTGIGFATAKRCAEEGARLFVSDVHERRLGEAVAKLNQVSATQVGSRLCDVTKEDQVQALIAAAIADMGQVDVLINNAGLGGSAPVVEMTDDQWHRVIDVTLTSVFRMTRAILPHMYARGSGAIVNNASVLGWRAQELQAHYAAAKAGVMAFTRCSAIEAAEKGIRINAVAPSIAMHEFLNKVTSSDLLAELSAREAFGRPAETWEIADVMVFLASDLASYMTGEIVSVSSQRPNSMPHIFNPPAELEGTVGQGFGPTEWLEIDQARIDLFADATGDHQWIHVDPARAKDGPFGATIAHGYLTLSLVNLFLPQLIEVRGISMGLNYGLNKVRFPAVVTAGKRVRGKGEMISVEPAAGGVQSIMRVTVEVEGGGKPACVAESISLWYPGWAAVTSPLEGEVGGIAAG